MNCSRCLTLRFILCLSFFETPSSYLTVYFPNFIPQFHNSSHMLHTNTSNYIGAAVLFSLLHFSCPTTAKRYNETYYDMTDDYTCAIQNQKKQKAAFPNWNWSKVAPSTKRQPARLTWEPILEPVAGCTGLPFGRRKQFSFVVALDRTWVTYYHQHKSLFRKQGYRTLESSANLLIDRASYLFQKQFGVVISARKVVALKTLYDGCGRGNPRVEDGTFKTSTEEQLKSAGVVFQPGDAGMLRFGVGSSNGPYYCHSSASVFGVCRPILRKATVKRPVFTEDGRIDYDGATKTLAHELGHFFGICQRGTKHCFMNGHLIKELADILKFGPKTTTYRARPQGLFLKFMTPCTPKYNDAVCGTVKRVSDECGVNIPPLKLDGRYRSKKNGKNGTKARTVRVSSKGDGEVVWSHSKNMRWTMARDRNDMDLLHPEKSNPFYDKGFKTARILTDVKNGKTVVLGIYGPDNTFYRKK